MERLITNITPGSALDDIQAWALKTLEGLPPATEEKEHGPIDILPEFLQKLDPQHGPDVWVVREGSVAKIEVSWWSFPTGAHAPFAWGLVLGKPDLKPRPTLRANLQSMIPVTFQELKPGVFAFYRSVKNKE